MEEIESPIGAFPATRASALQALRGSGEERTWGREVLARGYWPAVYRHVRLKWRKERAEAEELAQGFFLMMFEKSAFEAYDASRGRLRSYLKVCLERYLTNQHKAERRIKRGGAVLARLDVDGLEDEIARDDRTPEDQMLDAFDRDFAQTLVRHGVDVLRARYEKTDKATTFVMFERIALVDPAARPTYEALAREYDLTVFDVTNKLSAARRDFRRVVLDELRSLTTNEEEFRLEARDLLGMTG